jgi:serine/threonine-protein kinase
VIYEVFTGRVPFRGDTPIATLLKHIHDPPPLQPEDGGPELPAALIPVLARALAKQPADRHASARDLLEALRDAQRRMAEGPAPDAEAVPSPIALERVSPSATRGSTALSANLATEPLSEGVPEPPTRPPERPTVDLAPWRLRRLEAWPPWLRLAAPLALIAVSGAGLALLRQGPAVPAEPAASPAVQASPEATPPAATPPPPAAAGEGTLVVDALPWAEVEKIEDAAGRERPAGANRYTPFVASLPAGDYFVSLRHPGATERAILKVTVRAGAVETRTVALRKVDADAYLEKAGL